MATLKLLFLLFLLVISLSQGIRVGDDAYYHVTAQFGPTTYNLTASLVISDPEDQCEAPPNEDQYNGQIVLIFRGSCDFHRKALHAEQAGAVAVVIGNNYDGLIWMSPVDNLEDVTIPTVMVMYSDFVSLSEQQGLNAVLNNLEADGDIHGSAPNCATQHNPNSFFPPSSSVVDFTDDHYINNLDCFWYV